MCDLSDLANWKRFNEAASSEKTWMHERLSWLFTPQGILFAAYVLTFQKDTYPTDTVKLISALRLVIPGAGVSISIVVFIGVLAAGVMHWKWTTMLNELARRINANGNHVVPFGTKPHWPARSSSILPIFLSAIFVLAWLILLLC